MTVGELREKLAYVPAGAEVVILEGDVLAVVAVGADGKEVVE